MNSIAPAPSKTMTSTAISRPRSDVSAAVVVVIGSELIGPSSPGWGRAFVVRVRAAVKRLTVRTSSTSKGLPDGGTGLVSQRSGARQPGLPDTQLVHRKHG